jgi:hypothetical protein
MICSIRILQTFLPVPLDPLLAPRAPIVSPTPGLCQKLRGGGGGGEVMYLPHERQALLANWMMSEEDQEEEQEDE